MRRPRLLPHGDEVPEPVLAPLLKRLKSAVGWARTVRTMSMDEAARGLWEEAYRRLEAERHGLIAALTHRGSDHVRRLAMIYALLDGSALIRPCHLQAALAVWDFADAWVAYIWADALGDPVADESTVPW